MYKFQVYEKKRIYNESTVQEEPKEEWVVTHEITVPDKETLGMIMHATADQLAPKKTTYRD